MPSAMLQYVLASVPAGTISYLGSPVEATLATVLADAITSYGGGATTEAQCTDTVKFNAIGRALFWQWALEYVIAGDFAPAQLGQSEYAAHVAEIKRLRDYYADLANTYEGAPVQLADSYLVDDPYRFPRSSDTI